MKNIERNDGKRRFMSRLTALALVMASFCALAAVPVASPERVEEDPFTLVWMSDTQHYSASYPKTFQAMTKWVLDNREKENIQYVIHTGDVVHSRKKAAQWTNAQNATKGMIAEVPFFVVAGNHDTGTNSPSFTEFSRLYGPKVFADLPSLGGFYGDGVGRYDLFSVGSHDFIIAGLSYAHDKEAVAWLNGVLAEHKDRTAILAFHSYLNENGKLTSHGNKLYEDVVEKNPNVRLVLCGHKHGVTRRVSAIDDDGDGKADRRVHQLLANYQGKKQGGEGYMCLLEFDPSGQKITLRTYSPLLNQYKDSKEESFTILMDF